MSQESYTVVKRCSVPHQLINPFAARAFLIIIFFLNTRINCIYFFTETPQNKMKVVAMFYVLYLHTSVQQNYIFSKKRNAQTEVHTYTIKIFNLFLNIKEHKSNIQLPNMSRFKPSGEKLQYLKWSIGDALKRLWGSSTSSEL